MVVSPVTDGDGDAVVITATFRGSSSRLRLLQPDGVEVLADVPSHRAAEFAPTTRVSVGLLNRPVLLAASDD
jgi:putative spermidine/putrescine transport system ATP-binding protein